MSCKRLPISSFNFLIYDSLQGEFKIQDTLANNVHKPGKEEVHTVCKQVIELLFCPVAVDPLTDYTPVRKHLFLKHNPCIKQFYSLLKDSSQNQILEFMRNRYSKRLLLVAQRKFRQVKRKNKRRCSRKS